LHYLKESRLRKCGEIEAAAEWNITSEDLINTALDIGSEEAFMIYSENLNEMNERWRRSSESGERYGRVFQNDGNRH
jgi:hypothetical protein